MANVPDTDSFTLQDVVDSVNPTTDDLVDCFNDANDQYFDINYLDTKNDMLEFRNYGVASWFVDHAPLTLKLSDSLMNLPTSDPLIFYRGLNGEIPPSQTRNPTYATFLNDGTIISENFPNIEPQVLDNTNAIEYAKWVTATSMINWYDAIDRISYNGSKIGTFWVGFQTSGSNIKIYNTSNCRYDSAAINGTVYPFISFKITFIEALTPTGAILSKAASSGETFNICADGNYTALVTSGNSWITIITGSGTDEGTITYAVTENTTGVNREGNIQVTTNNEVFDFPINQLNMII